MSFPVPAKGHLTLPAATVERLRVEVRVDVDGLDDVTALDVDTILSDACDQPHGPAPGDGDDWAPASWVDDRTILTHLITGQPAGRYGLWLRLHNDDETPILWCARITLT